MDPSYQHLNIYKFFHLKNFFIPSSYHVNSSFVYLHTEDSIEGKQLSLLNGSISLAHIY